MADYRLELTGGIWWPMGAKCATTASYQAGTDAEAIESVDFHAGDFSSVDDFQLERVDRRECKDVEGWSHFAPHPVIVRPWASEDGEFQFQDAMYPSED